jgi:hypothetical protein
MLPNELGPLARPSDLMYQQSRMLSRRYDRIDVLVEVDVCVSNGSTTNACCWVGWLSECGADLLLESTRITNHLIECCCCCLAGCCLAGCCQLLVMLMCCLLDSLRPNCSSPKLPIPRRFAIPSSFWNRSSVRFNYSVPSLMCMCTCPIADSIGVCVD